MELTPDLYIGKTFIMADDVELSSSFAHYNVFDREVKAKVNIGGQVHTYTKHICDDTPLFIMMKPIEVRNAAIKEALQMAYDIWHIDYITRREVFTAVRDKKCGVALDDILEYVLNDQEALDTLFKEYEAYKKEQEEKNKKPEPKEMTVAEIEKALGYPVKVVK